LRFGRYALDLARGSLFLEEREIPLRPKTFEVLRVLVENAGRLVSKDKLFTEIWTNLAVTDDTLVQSIAELRRSFGDDGPRFIRTVPRRGYRFDAAVVRSESSDGKPRPSTIETAASVIRFAKSKKLLSPGLAAAFLLAVAAILAINHQFSFAPFNERTANEQARRRPAIAVLPFRVQGDGSNYEYLSDGLTQEIIGALGRFSALTVMSWNAVFPYKGKPAAPSDVARALATQYQVEGSIWHFDQRLRVNVQLVDADGRVLWSNSFDEADAGFISLQNRITTQITGALAIRVTQAEQLRALKKSTESMEAYDYVLRAKTALHRPERDNIANSRALLNRAIGIDPNFAMAYSALAETYLISVSMGWAETPSVFLNRAAELSRNALALDDSNVRARIVLGRIHLFHQRYEQAKAELDQAVAINPSDAQGLAAYGNILMWLGDADASLEMLEQAERIDPKLSAFDRNAISMAHYIKGRYEAAIRQAELTIDKTGVSHFSHVLMAAAYAQLDRFDEVSHAVKLIRLTDPTFDAAKFGTKFLNPADLEHFREGLRRAGLYAAE
jgi:adenylate cyclase